MGRILLKQLLVFSVAIISLSLSANTHAQSDEMDYQTTVRQAIQELSAGNPADARELFRKAHALQPSARTLRGIALTSFEIQDFAETRRAASASLESEVNPLTPAMQAEMNELIDRTASELAYIEFEVEQAGVMLFVDGKELEQTTSPHYVNPGEYRVEAELPGYQPYQATLQLGAGDTEQLRIALEPVVPEAVAQEKRGLNGAHWASIAVGGAAVALGVTALGTGIRSRGIENSLDAECPSNRCEFDPSDQANKGRRLALTSTITSFTALAAAGLGVGLWFVGQKKSKKSDGLSELRLLPVADIHGASLQLTGAF